MPDEPRPFKSSEVVIADALGGFFSESERDTRDLFAAARDVIDALIVAGYLIIPVNKVGNES